MECREIVDSAKESPIELSGCKDCDKLQILFNENPGGKPIRRTGLILAAIVGKKITIIARPQLIYRLLYCPHLLDNYLVLRNFCHASAGIQIFVEKEKTIIQY